MKLKNIFTYAFGNWLRPFIFFAFTIVFFFINKLVASELLLVGTIILFCIALLGLLISTVYQLINKHWMNALFTGTVFICVVLPLLYVSWAAYIFSSAFKSTDGFANNLKIPSDIIISNPIEIPVETSNPDTVRSLQLSQSGFQLYNSFQPGLYEYDLWIGKIGKGTVYLKVFEVTQNTPLSESSVYKRSTIEVYNSTDTIKRFSTKSDFTIYEGDWGKPYAARFEVWFQPDRFWSKERKLFEKNYKIEGWQR
ncbi:MAG: hypothetical protein NTY88_12475 [Bacteroidetes bacterium]|nr:hypothetical protein [Bacteroidota bacterium]